MLVLAAILSLFIGLSLGLLGGGGSILTLPILVYVLQVEPKTAIAMSLFVVGTTSATGVLAHARAGRVRFRTGLIFGVAGMAGAFLGGRIAHLLPATVLLVAFGVVMLTAAVAMMRPRRDEPASATKEPALAKALAVGVAVGVVAGLVGAGGGFLIVPALALFAGLAMPEAIGTSLLVISLQSFAGFAGHAGSIQLDWTLTAIVTASAVAGGLGGARLARHVSPASLRKGFAWLVLAMAIFLLGKQIPAATLVTIRVAVLAHLPLLLATTGVLVLALVAGLLLRVRLQGPPKESRAP